MLSTSARQLFAGRPTAPLIIGGTLGILLILILALHSHGSVEFPKSFSSIGGGSSRPGFIARPYERPKRPKASRPPPSFSPNPELSGRHHIDELVDFAQASYNDLISQSTTGVEEAAQAYRARRGRHPPPGFDKWVLFAESKSTVMIESFYDRMQTDLEPYWAMPVYDMRRFSTDWPNILSIRGGLVRKFRMREGSPEWLSRWQEMIEQLPLADLPDVDLAFNPDEAPHIFLRREEMSKMLREARKSKHTRAPGAGGKAIHGDFQKLPEITNYNRTWDQFDDGLDKAMHETWYFARSACPESSPARRAVIDFDESSRVVFPNLREQSYMSNGYISNWTEARSVCHNPSLRHLHGYFVYPTETTLLGNDETPWATRMMTRHPFPLLSSSKLGGRTNGEILVPGAMNYILKAEALAGAQMVQAESIPWEDKKNKISWRGVASGGLATLVNWRRLHRYRLVSMLNASHVRLEADALAREGRWTDKATRPADFALPDVDLYQMKETSVSSLLTWLRSVTDAVFTRVPVGCWPAGTDPRQCTLINGFYSTGDEVSMTDFFQNKYMLDVDGPAYSVRFQSLLLSNSVPIKATIWDEWSEGRLVAWQHFVPMDNGMGDLWGIMDYFLGAGHEEETRRQRDTVGKQIATQGRAWTQKVMRKEDMEVYMYRLILELARLNDDRREDMGYAEDLSAPASPEAALAPLAPLA